MNIKDVEKQIGKKNMKKFDDFMRGQTIGILDDGSFDYYVQDVEKFKRVIKP